MVSLHNNTLVTKTMAQRAEVPVTWVCLPEPTNRDSQVALWPSRVYHSTCLMASTHIDTIMKNVFKKWGSEQTNKSHVNLWALHEWTHMYACTSTYLTPKKTRAILIIFKWNILDCINPVKSPISVVTCVTCSFPCLFPHKISHMGNYLTKSTKKNLGLIYIALPSHCLLQARRNFKLWLQMWIISSKTAIICHG